MYEKVVQWVCMHPNETALFSLNGQQYVALMGRDGVETHEVNDFVRIANEYVKYAPCITRKDYIRLQHRGMLHGHVGVGPHYFTVGPYRVYGTLIQ